MVNLVTRGLEGQAGADALRHKILAHSNEKASMVQALLPKLRGKVLDWLVGGALISPAFRDVVIFCSVRK
jgi:hypothetical protein